jgi:hypothetical protein
MQLKTPKDLAIKARMMGKKTISYSQFNMYKQCPHHWRLSYIDGHKVFEPSIFLTFGTAMHEVLQEYLQTMYDTTAKAADELPLEANLKGKMATLYKESVEDNDGKHYSSKDELTEFYYDGCDIIDFFKKKRGAYFSKKNCELVGIEMPLLVETDENEKIMMMGFQDIVIKESYQNGIEKLKILDIKTSTFGWREGQKRDNGDQLRIYKKYFSKQYNVPEENIEIEYFIVKRKLYENCDFPQRRVQIYRPPSGKPSMNKTSRSLAEFIKTAFTKDGKHNKDREYPAISGKNNKNCKWCEFKSNYDLCPKQNRMKE